MCASVGILLSACVLNLTMQDHGDTPLFIASQTGNIEVVNLLLQHAPDVNATWVSYPFRASL